MGRVRLMLAYRVFPYKPSAQPGEIGHATYRHPVQGLGRIDNPHRYRAMYFAREPAGAIGETFGSRLLWDDDMFQVGNRDPALVGARRALAVFHLPDDLALLDLDHAYALHERGMRPTAVVERNRRATQAWALRIFEETAHDGNRRWSGVQWWSYHLPPWRIMGLWDITPRLLNVEKLTPRHPAVVDAAGALSRVV